MSTTNTMNLGDIQAAIAALVAQQEQNAPKGPAGKALPPSPTSAVPGNGVAANRAIATQAARGTVADGRTVLRPPVQQSGQGMTSVKGGKVVHGPSVQDMADADQAMAQELEDLRAENARLKAQRGQAARLSLKVSEKGALSVYGLGRFPQTLYKEQWLRLLAVADDIREFIADNDRALKAKGE